MLFDGKKLTSSGLTDFDDKNLNNSGSEYENSKGDHLGIARLIAFGPTWEDDRIFTNTVLDIIKRTRAESLEASLNKSCQEVYD